MHSLSHKTLDQTLYEAVNAAVEVSIRIQSAHSMSSIEDMIYIFIYKVTIMKYLFSVNPVMYFSMLIQKQYRKSTLVLLNGFETQVQGS